MMNAGINFWPLWTFAKNLSSEPIFRLLLDLPLKSLTWTVLKISTRYNRCSKVRFPSNRFPLHPSPSPPGSAATHSKYYGKRIKTIWLSHLLLLDCVALLLVTIHAVSAAQERPSPQHLYALLSCARGLVRLAGPTLVWALHPRAGTGLWYFFRLKTFHRLNSILFFIRSNLKLNVWCYHQKRIVLSQHYPSHNDLSSVYLLSATVWRASIRWPQGILPAALWSRTSYIPHFTEKGGAQGGDMICWVAITKEWCRVQTWALKSS